MKKLRNIYLDTKKFLSLHWNFVIVFLFGVFVTIGIWSYINKIIPGHDAVFHYARLAGGMNAIADGQIVPQIDPYAAGGAGYGYNLFYGPLLAWITGLIIFFLGYPYVVINAVFCILIVLSGLAMVYAAEKISKNKIVSALAGIIFLCSPYFLADIYIRVAVGEFVSFLAAPFLLLGLYKLIKSERNAVPCLVFAITWLMLSHNLSTLIFAIMSVLILLFNPSVFKKRDFWIRSALAAMVSFGLTAVFTLPMLEARQGGDYAVFRTVDNHPFMGNSGNLNGQRIGLAEIFINSARGDGLVFGVGIVAIIALISFPFIYKHIDASRRQFTKVLYIVAIISLILTSNTIDWRMLPESLGVLQFPWRFLSIFVICMSYVGAETIYFIMNKIISYLLDNKKSASAAEHMKLMQIGVVATGLAMILNVSSILALGIAQHRDSNSGSLSGVGTLGWSIEYAPYDLVVCDTPDTEICNVGMKYDALLDLDETPKIVSGEMEIGKYQYRAGHYDLDIVAYDDSIIEFPLIWYPGYVASLGEQKFEVMPSEKYGLVQVKIPAEISGEMKLYYGMSPATKLGLGISGATIVVVVVYGGIRYFWQRKNRTLK